MIYQRMLKSESLASKLAQYDGRPAIFYQRAASADDLKWGRIQYPRISYFVDTQENPARNTSGILNINVWCDVVSGAEPEDIEPILIELFHAAFAQADENLYCFAWSRSDAFEVKNQQDQSVQTIGVSVAFDIMACPCQYSMNPDPIQAMNLWTKTVLPNAIVIGEDEIEGWLEPTREKPVIYWRITSQGIQRRHFAYTWLNIGIEGHVYAKDAADRLYNLRILNTAAALIAHVTMEDGSPLFLTKYSFQPHMAYLTQGQIKINGYFGLLQPWYGKQPDPKLNRVGLKNDATITFKERRKPNEGSGTQAGEDGSAGQSRP